MGRWELEVIHQVGDRVRICGIEAKRLALSGFQVYEKAADDYVTDVDRALDAYLSKEFTALFPDDGLVTEENSTSLLNFWQPYPRLWCIDPLDGTQDFIKGDPGYSVMVGAMEQQQPIAGWIYAPEYEALYYGGREFGLWQSQNGQTPRILYPNYLDYAPTLILGHKDFQRFGSAFQRAIPTLKVEERAGSFGLKVLEVLRGKAGLYVYLNQRVKVWDTVAPLAIARTAGLMCCDLKGQALHYTRDSLDGESLAHRQTIVIGWQPLVETWLPTIQEIVQKIT
ncbi:MAG: inositol monophosphatase family protein [Cyanobacteria bacterium]|nr:inositol monophosphatase family protein [Cyanobacteriota bacterium]